MLRVRDAMTRDVITLGTEASAGEALGLCRQYGIRHLPVVDKDSGRLVGLVSDRDLRDVSPPRGSGEEATLTWVRLRDVMTPNPLSIHPLDTIEHAAQMIYENKIGCLPVVADGELAGIVTSSDMMRTLTELIGAHSTGSWVEVEVPNQPGALAAVTDVARDRRVNIASVFVAPAQRASYRTIVLRLETTNPKGIVQSLEEAGYRVTAVESSVPATPNLEES